MLAERDGPSGLQRLCHWASQLERPTQYAALYAFKYLGMRHSIWKWLTDPLLSGRPNMQRLRHDGRSCHVSQMWLR
jgi:hypothetical protein